MKNNIESVDPVQYDEEEISVLIRHLDGLIDFYEKHDHESTPILRSAQEKMLAAIEVKDE